jgi:hypothetical protein
MQPLQRSLLLAGVAAAITMSVGDGLPTRSADASAERGNNVASAVVIPVARQGDRAPVVQPRVSHTLREMSQYHILIIEPPSGWRGNMPCVRPPASFRSDMPVLKPRGVLGTNVDRLPSVRVLVPSR